MTNEQLSDEQLWNALREGDQDAFSALYQRFYATLYSYGYKVADNVTLVEDAIQDLFVDLWRMRHSVSGAESVKFYLFRSLRRKIHVQSKKEGGLHIDNTEIHAAAESYSAEHPLLYAEEQSQLTERITYALAKLPRRQQEVITLRFYQGFKNEEIARIMGITEKSVRNTLHKALSHLREHAPFLAPLLGFLLWWLAAS